MPSSVCNSCRNKKRGICNLQVCTVCSRVQVIKHATDKIDPNADFVVLDRYDWKPVAAGGEGLNVKCALYELPKRCKEGKKIIFLNHHNAISVLQHQDRFGALPSGSPATNAEFWHIQLNEHDDLVELQFIDYSHGWTVVRKQGHAEVQSIRAHPPKYLYTLCTFRRMPDEAHPADARDFIATIDIMPSSPTYGKIVHIALGSQETGAEEDTENALEYHHGDLTTIDGKHYLVAPSLNFKNSAIDFFCLDSEKAPALCNYLSDTETDTVKYGTGTRSAKAFHTTHVNHQTGDVLVSYLGNDNGDSPSGFMKISPNIGSVVPYGQPHNLVPEIYSEMPKTGPDTTGAQNDDYNYDYHIDDCNSQIACTSWGPPNSFDTAFNPANPYGRAIRIFNMPAPGGPTGTNALTLEHAFATTPYVSNADTAGGEGLVPLEVRRTHVPGQQTYFVGITLPGGVVTVYKDGTGWHKKIVVSPAQLVADCKNITKISNQTSSTRVVVPAGDVLGAGTLSVPLVTDITLSEDDHFLYVSCWLAGVLLQYDVRDPLNPVLAGGVGNLGGVMALFNTFNTNSYEYAPGKQYAGGPQMLRLDPAGQNLYVTNSLFSSWDDQFYTAGVGSIREQGGMLIKLKTGVKRGEKVSAMSIDTGFAQNGVVEFVDLEHPQVSGPFTSRAHESHMMGVRH